MDGSDVRDLRREIMDAAKSGDATAATVRLHQLWEADRGPSAASIINKTLRQLGGTALRRQKIAILRSHTVEPVVPLLEAICRLNGVEVELWVGGFNAYAQEILDPGSSLYAFSPDLAILAIEARDLLPATMSADDPTGAELWQEEVSHAVSLMEMLIRTFRQRTGSALVVHGLDVPVCPAAGILDAQSEAGQGAAIEAVNRAWRGACQATTGVFFLDYRALVARFGQLVWYDSKKWIAIRLPVAARFLAELAEEWARFVFPTAGRTGKVLVLDMDNVLWGGEIGEDGMEGIKLGDESEGNAFLNVHRAALALQKTGILLATCSKNTDAIARSALDEHPNGLLRSTDFAAHQINWNRKPDNVMNIAAALNVGLESLVFVDDQPAERSAMRAAHPELTTIELPAAPMEYAARILRHPVFARLSLSAEDSVRARYYEEDASRRALAVEAATPEEFLRGLKITVALVSDPSPVVPRIAQLTQKTNQFNTTTRRYSEVEIENLIADPQCRVVVMSSADRFGDQGIVAVGILRANESSAGIDTFLMSCRVIGRGIETALLTALGQASTEMGCHKIEGRFLPTEKNGPVADLFERHGFSQMESAETGTAWEAPLADFPVTWPDWISRHEKMARNAA